MTAEQYVEWRKLMGFTHAEAAKQLGVTERTSYHYASGDRSINDTVAKLCEKLLEEKLNS